MSSYGQYGPGHPGGVYYPTRSQEATPGISLDPEFIERINRMEKMINKIAERLAVLDDPDPETLARHKMLKEAYMKYLFIEKLCMEEEIKDNES